MMTFIDISNWQAGMNLARVLESCDAAIIKATEGVGYVDPSCDGFVQTCKGAGKRFGFYHFARNNNAIDEAEFFYKNAKNYFGDGIPVLDWEDGQSVAWVNSFVDHLYKLSGVWCWVYGNAWRFNQGTVNENCMRWVAGYPGWVETFETARGQACPYSINNGVLGAWQFTSTGNLAGYSGNLDLNVFYGTESAWDAFSGKDYELPKETLPELEKGALYRLYNPNNGAHMLTTSYQEAQHLFEQGWDNEGEAFKSGSSTRVFRFYNQNNGDHLFTIDPNEILNLLEAGWTAEGVAFRTGSETGVSRLYNANSGQHFFTTDQKETNSLIEDGWNYEGIAFRAN